MSRLQIASIVLVRLGQALYTFEMPCPGKRGMTVDDTMIKKMCDLGMEDSKIQTPAIGIVLFKDRLLKHSSLVSK